MYHVIVNSISLDEQHRADLETVKNIFDRTGKKYEVHLTQYKGHAKDIARSITETGEFAHIVAMGGDGTLHEVLNGITDIENCAVGLIPCGTGNDFATTAGIPLDAKAAMENIIFRAPTTIDYIELESGLRSINAIGLGMDVDVLKRAYQQKHDKRNKYFSAFLKSLRKYKAANIKVSWDGGEEQQVKGLLACLGNGTQIGGGIKLFPDAKIDDGYLNLIFVKYLSRFRTIIAFLKLLTGKVNKVKEVTYVKCKQVEITAVDACPTIQAEGELYDNVHIKARIVTGKLKFYLPSRDD